MVTRSDTNTRKGSLLVTCSLYVLSTRADVTAPLGSDYFTLMLYLRLACVFNDGPLILKANFKPFSVSTPLQFLRRGGGKRKRHPLHLLRGQHLLHAGRLVGDGHPEGHRVHQGKSGK